MLIREMIEIVREAMEESFVENPPTELFHATFRQNLPSIMKHGLGGGMSRSNFDISCRKVVYLSDNPDVAENYAREAAIVKDINDDIIILKVDTTKIDLSSLEDDENDDGDMAEGLSYSSYEYHGVIPPEALSVH